MPRHLTLALTGGFTLLLALAACTGTTDDTRATPSAHPPTGPDAVITLYSDGVRAGANGGRLADAHTGTRLRAGSHLTTDQSGLAAVAFDDGSVLRAGADTVLALTALTTGRAGVGLTSGHTWHRIEGRSAASDYRVSSPLGAFDGAGATFALDCAGELSCTLTVFDGTVTATPDAGTPITVAAYQRLTLRAAEKQSAPVTFPVDATLMDAWFGVNRALDTEDGRSGADVQLPSVQAAASLAGKWRIDTVVTSSGDPKTPKGTPTHRDWSFEPAECAEACTVALSRTYGALGQAASRTVTETLSYADGKFRAHIDTASDCSDAAGHVLAPGYFAQTNTYDLHVAAVESRTGVPTATRLEGTSSSTVGFAGSSYVAGCYLDSIAPTVQRVVGTLVSSAAHAESVSAPLAQPAVAVRPVSTSRPTASGGLGSAPAPATRSVLSSLTTLQGLDLSLLAVAGTVGIAFILMLIVGYPAHLLNSTISGNYDRIFWWVEPVKKRFARVRATGGRPPGSPKPGSLHRRRLGIALGIVVGSVIAAFVDPGFGFNVASLRVMASVAVSFVVGSLCAWLLVAWVVRRLDTAAAPTVRFRYGSLLIVVGAVVFSRLTGFEPGMVFGLVVGLTLGVTLATAASAKLTLTGLGYSLAVSLTGWLAFSLLGPVLGDDPGFLGVFLLETLSGFAIGGFVSLPLTLLPLDAFDGGTLFAWRKSVWAAAYVVGLSAFLLILLPLPSSWGTVQTPLAAWLAAYLGFALFAVAFWAYFRLRPTRDRVVATVSADAP